MTLGVFSVITILIGVAMVILSIRFTTSNFSQDVKALGNYQTSAFYMLLAGAITAVVTGVCGVVVCVKRVPILVNVIVGLFFLIAFLLLSINGIAIAMISNTKEETLQAFCNSMDENNGIVVNRLRAIVSEVDTNLGATASKAMCSDFCPCSHANNTDWTLLTKTQLDKYGREAPFMFTAKPTESFGTFAECFIAKTENEAPAGASNESKAKAEQYKKILAGSGYNAATSFLEYFEEAFACSGICEIFLFYWTRPLSDGIPKSTCLTYLKREIGNNLTYMGVIALIAGIITWFSFLVQYCLWKKYD